MSQQLKEYNSPSLTGSFDGLRPQYLKDMLDVTAPDSLDVALLDFCNLVLAGGVPIIVRPAFFRGALYALAKPDGGYKTNSCWTDFA